MIGIVLVTHGRIGAEMMATLETILAQKQDCMKAVDVMPGDPMDQKRREIAEAVEAVRDPIGRHGVLVITDMVGGTPSNLAVRMMRGGSVHVVTGLNMPMLISVARARQRSSLETLGRLAIEAGRKFVDHAPGGAARREAPLNE